MERLPDVGGGDVRVLDCRNSNGLMAGSSRGEFSGGGEQSVVVVRLTAEARQRRSAAGQPGLDPW